MPRKPDQLALLAATELVRKRREREEQELVFTTPYLAQVCLPYRDPGDIPVWEKRNGDVLLTIRPGYTQCPETGRAKSLGYPFGLVPRWTQLYLIQKARELKSPIIPLGSGPNEFFRFVNPGRAITGGKNGSLTRTAKQTTRLFHAAISIEDKRRRADGAHASLTTNMSVAHRLLLWGDVSGDNAEIQLSADFYEQITKHSVPLDLNALMVFGDDPVCIDLYTFLSWRMFNLKRPLTIPLMELAGQLGTTRVVDKPKPRYNFRKSLEPKLVRVMSVWPDAADNIELTADGLKIRPSNTHVPLKGKAQVLRSLGITPGDPSISA